MAQVTITVAAFPNVPNLPGVPQLARNLLFPPSPTPSLGSEAAQGTLWQASQSQMTWGILDADNNVVIEPDSFLSFDDREEWRLSDYPIQNGGFGTFNKVIVPAEQSVRMSKGGSLSDRTDFLNQIAAIAGDTNLYTILTPERTYTNVNVMRYEVTRRGAQGAFFLAEVDVFFRQINAVTAQYTLSTANTTNAQNPAAVPSYSQGTVQTTDVPDAAAAQAAAALVGAP